LRQTDGRYVPNQRLPLETAQAIDAMDLRRQIPNDPHDKRKEHARKTGKGMGPKRKKKGT
jgi:hypothetical protein